MQMGFYFDQTKCVGCYACDYVCKLHYALAPDVHWRRILWINSDKPLCFVSLPCMHCEEPPCVEQCPAGAITKRAKDGIVVVDQDKCSGKDNCDMCVQACPYDIPQFGPESNAKMSKCNFCLDRIEEDKKPWCVIMCNQAALDFGPLDELIARYGDLKEARGFEYSTETKPSMRLMPALAGGQDD